jgi:hypothetical protein
MRCRRLSFAAIALAATSAPIVFEPVTHVRADVVLSGPDLPGSVGFLEFEGGPKDSPSASLALPWPAGSRLVVRAPDGVGARGNAVALEALVQRDGRTLARSVRTVELGTPSSSLWEVYRSQGRRVVLGVRADRKTRPALPEPPEVGRPVAFRVFVERVSGDAVTLLETNDLHSFLDQSVAYSFRRGAGVDEERLELRLLPVKIVGDVLQVAVELEARLPGPDAPAPFRKRQTLFATRGVESAISGTSGDPPAGYRFRVLAEF